METDYASNLLVRLGSVVADSVLLTPDREALEAAFHGLSARVASVPTSPPVYSAEWETAMGSLELALSPLRGLELRLAAYDAIGDDDSEEIALFSECWDAVGRIRASIALLRTSF